MHRELKSNRTSLKVLHIAILVPAVAKSKTPPHGVPVDRKIPEKSIKKFFLRSTLKTKTGCLKTDN